MNYTEEDAGRIEACSHCSARLTLPSLPESQRAARQKVHRGWGWWSLVKFLGALIAIAGFVWMLVLVSTVLMSSGTSSAWGVAGIAAIPGFIVMLVGRVLFALGRNAAIHFICSNCGKSVRKDTQVCPGCGSALS